MVTEAVNASLAPASGQQSTSPEIAVRFGCAGPSVGLPPDSAGHRVFPHDSRTTVLLSTPAPGPLARNTLDRGVTRLTLKRPKEGAQRRQ